LNYTVYIRNPTNTPIFYTLNGEGETRLQSRYLSTHRGTGNPSISFDNGRHQTIVYDLERGKTYYFQWRNGVLDLIAQ
jgi:hypothetical protein